ncbi:helix-turn-helix domain-containing protein [Chryseomicrobium palamuruense]|uniref:Helix-turn-helix domain-containing protein n=1 Tax=Chryseomicrobium palamuruense TaxID=682973 RepID=A0ABV8USU5_9BACL
MKYGSTVRDIRKKKGITLHTLADGVCSVSFLSKFERGESDISLELMTQLLEKLMIPFEEFLYMHHDYSLDSVQNFFQTAGSLYITRNQEGLHQLKKEQHAKWKEYGIVTYHNNALLLEVYESIVAGTSLSQEIQTHHVQLLSDYLFGVEEWGFYELSLYNGTMLLLEPEMVMSLSKTAYVKSSRFRDYEKVNTLVTSILFNTVIYLIGPVNRFDDAFHYRQEMNEFLAYLEDIAIPEQRLFEKLHLMQLKGIYDIRIGKKEEGRAQVEATIQLLYSFNAPKLADNIRHYLQQIL